MFMKQKRIYRGCWMKFMQARKRIEWSLCQCGFRLGNCHQNPDRQIEGNSSSAQKVQRTDRCGQFFYTSPSPTFTACVREVSTGNTRTRL